MGWDSRISRPDKLIDPVFSAERIYETDCYGVREGLRFCGQKARDEPEDFMPCTVHQSLLDTERRIWGAWKRLNDKANRSASETEEMHRLPGRAAIAAMQ